MIRAKSLTDSHWTVQLVSYLTFTLRGMGEQFETFGEALVLTSLRLCQDCPPNAILSRRVSFEVLYFPS